MSFDVSPECTSSMLCINCVYIMLWYGYGTAVGVGPVHTIVKPPLVRPLWYQCSHELTLPLSICIATEYHLGKNETHKLPVPLAKQCTPLHSTVSIAVFYDSEYHGRTWSHYHHFTETQPRIKLVSIATSLKSKDATSKVCFFRLYIHHSFILSAVPVFIPAAIIG